MYLLTFLSLNQLTVINYNQLTFKVTTVKFTPKIHTTNLLQLQFSNEYSFYRQYSKIQYHKLQHKLLFQIGYIMNQGHLVAEFRTTESNQQVPSPAVVKIPPSKLSKYNTRLQQ